MTYDIILRNGHVIDPKSCLDETADVAIAEGRIAAVGDLAGAAANAQYDLRGYIVTPG